MATVNVTTANTFEEWRVKSNEMGTAIGNLTNLTEPLAGATDIVAALGDHETRTEAIDALIGVDALWDAGGTYVTITKAANKNHADITTLAATAGIDLATNSLSGYDGDETTLVAILDAQFAFDGGKAGATNMTTTAQTLAPAIEEVHGEVTTATTKLGTISAAAMGTTAATVGPAILELHGELTTATSNIAALGATYVAVAGDTMTGKLITASSGLGGSNAGVSAATLLTLGTGSSTALQINSSQRIGVGTTAHASHKVDVSGVLNATTLSYGGTDLKSIFFEQGEAFEDAVYAMFDGSSQTGGISVSYDDTNGELDLAIADNGHAHTVGNVTGFDAQVHALVGAMVGSNTESGITVDYQSGDQTIDFNVLDPTITLTGDVSGAGTMTNLGNVTIETTRAAGNVSSADIAADAIDGTKIADNAINSEHYTDGSIDEAHVANDAISRAKLKDEVVLLIINSAGTTVKTMYGAGS